MRQCMHYSSSTCSVVLLHRRNDVRMTIISSFGLAVRSAGLTERSTRDRLLGRQLNVKGATLVPKALGQPHVAAAVRVAEHVEKQRHEERKKEDSVAAEITGMDALLPGLSSGYRFSNCFENQSRRRLTGTISAGAAGDCWISTLFDYLRS